MGKTIYLTEPSANCAHCGSIFVKGKRYKKSGRFSGYHHAQIYCNFVCKNKAQYPEDKKTGYIDNKGYRRISVNGKQREEHRLVMEKIIGRKLLSNETVHHKNGQRLDNRPENLELWSSRHGRGQRVEDRIKDCVEFLREYAPEHLKTNAGCDVIYISDCINRMVEKSC